MKPYPYNVKTDCKRGAPMGRSDVGHLEEGARLHVKHVPLNPYDPGGAYWGYGEPLWCLFNSDRSCVRWIRATTRAKVRELVEDEQDNVTLVEWDG